MNRLKAKLQKIWSPSVKEGMDNLPLGIAFVNSYGIVICCNHTMHRVSSALQDSELQNGELFWEAVKAKGEAMEAGDFILRFADGEIWILSRRECRLMGARVYEITAQNATEEIRLIDSVRENNKRMESIGLRLKQYNKNALELTKSRELLERKEYTHKELGRLLSATRHFLSGGGVDEAGLWHRWHINAALMLEESKLPSKEENLSESLRRTALAIGVNLVLRGDAPRGKDVTEMLLAAGGECLTNLLRHTGSDTLYVQVENGQGEDVLTFWDDGVPLEEEIVEGGGLTSLRRKAQKMGAQMEVLSRPTYKLIFTIPVTGGER